MATQDGRTQVPMIVIVNEPALSIKTVNITFDMEVKSSTQDVSGTKIVGQRILDVQQRWPGGNAKFHIQGSLSDPQEQRSQHRHIGEISFEVLQRTPGCPKGWRG